MLWDCGLYPKHLAFCRPPAQPNLTKISLPDRDVLLDRHLCLLPHDQNPVPADLFRIHLGRGTKPRLGGAGFPAIRLAELPLPMQRARRATMVHGWPSDRIDRAEQSIRPDPSPRHRWVSENSPVHGQPQTNRLP